VGLLVSLLFARSTPARVARTIYFMSVGLALLWATGFTITVGQRELSFDAAVVLGTSVITNGDDGPSDEELSSALAGTRQWRLEWWQDIADDVSDGSLLVQGHGWNTNLADEYGFQFVNQALTERDKANFPHNVVLSITGHGGLALAIAFAAVPILTLVATRPRRGPSPGLLVDAAWHALLATFVVSLFEVVVDRPSGGVLFWILIGTLWWSRARPFERSV
jgi:hypothetical protein